MSKIPTSWILYLVIQSRKYITLEIIRTALMLTFVLLWVLFILYFTTYIKDQYWSRLITHQWAVKRLLKRALEATENIDHILLGQKCPWPRILLTLELHYCPLSSASQHPNPTATQVLKCQRLQKNENIEYVPDVTLKHQIREHISINSIPKFYIWVQSLILNTMGKLINYNVYLVATIYWWYNCE